MTGEVVLLLTIDADGHVTDAVATNDEKPAGVINILRANAISNIRLWTFAKPLTAPDQQTIVCDYEFDESSRAPNQIPKVTFDFPDRVHIGAIPRVIDPSRSTKR